MEMLFDNGKTKVCQPFLDYPFQYDSGFGSATGVSTDENMIICGGHYARTRKCMIYRKGKGWSKLANMGVPRSQSASVPIPGGILVSGGYDGVNFLKSNLIVSTDGSVQKGGELPEPRNGHCLVEYQGQIISTGGGAFGKEFSNVWMFNNKEEFSLVKETQMKQKRYNHGCGIFYSNKHDGRPLLVVAGGWTDGERSSEFWDFTKPGAKWELTSQDLPLKMAGNKIAPTADGKGLLMTYLSGIYGFRCDSPQNCYWVQEYTKLNKLKIPRSWHVFLKAPKSLVEDCQR